MLRSILVPLDGSPFGEQALPQAMALARRDGATLELVHVHRPLASLYSANEVMSDMMLDATLREQGQAYLDRVAERVRATVKVPVNAALLCGPVAEVIIEQAVAAKADLMVMTTHGRGPLVRFWLGSVADKVARRSPVPVLLIHPQDGPLDWKKAPPIKRILVPLDGSEVAEKILDPVFELAGTSEVEYELLRVVEPFYVPDYPLDGNVLGQAPPTLYKRIEEDARAYLDGVAARLRARSVRVHPRLVLERPAVEAILDEAKAHQCSVIAVESRGRGGLSRMVLGSVADKIIRGSTIPVLIHHPVERRGP